MADSMQHDGPGNGIIGGYDGNNAVILRAITAFSAIAWYNSIETLAVVLFIFKRWGGLYFWSLQITAFATICYQIGAFGKLLEIVKPDIVGVVFLNVFWIFMVTGQSIVLYSRLHLVTHNQNVLRFVLGMIIFDTIVLYIPTATLNYGSSVVQTDVWIRGYSVFEKIQMTWFSVQEITISGLYLYEIANMFKVTQEEGTRKVLIELILLNVALILLDVSLLIVEYMNLYMIETTLKGMVYSVKLKLELAVLSKIVRMAKKRRHSSRVTTPRDIILRKTLEPNEDGLAPTITSEPPEPRRNSSTISPFDTAHLEGGSTPASSEEEYEDSVDAKLRTINSRGIPIHDNEDLEQYKQRRESTKRRSTEGLYPGRLGGEDFEVYLKPAD